MAKLLQLLFFTLYSLILLLHGTADQIPKAYVVYMGSSISNNERGAEIAEAAHLKILSSITVSGDSERSTLIHSYHHAFLGFSAMLTEKEANMLSGKDGIISVFPDPILQLHTTRSWDFLKDESGVKLPESLPISDDVIIGMIDTGIWPESPSFNDEGIGEIPSRWNGTCMEGPYFKSSMCNRKIIGARYYNTESRSNQSKFSGQRMKTGNSPRDSVGHGTHTASTAAGSPVPNASYYGLAPGTAKGGSPSSRLAMYKACSIDGCSGSNILKAIDDAIQDGVDIISISIGMSSFFQSDFLSDPIAIGAFHANQKGVLVVCSAGNDGPDPSTVVNSAPWIFTVGASTIDRDFQSSVVLGDGQVFKGSAINFSNLTRSEVYPLVFAGDIPANSTPTSEASNCYPGSLDIEKAAGKIIVCMGDDPMVSRKVKKLVAETSRAKGLILIDQLEGTGALDSGDFPFSEIHDSIGNHILNYINSTRKPKATILPTIAVVDSNPAPAIAYFSSRGPGEFTETILKPDVTAPGVCILACSIPASQTGNVPEGQKPSKFAIKSGTSMACPHVTGAAAFLKSVHPNWTSSMIKSALMTTATTSNNHGKPLSNSTFVDATPLDMGAGEISPLRAVDPGLVYETTMKDYFHFLCYYGYKESIIATISGTNFSCPSDSHEDLISNLNYPSIAISALDGRGAAREVTRTLTNVGPANATYTASVDATVGLEVKVSPETLVFSPKTTRASFDVSFSGKRATKGYGFGSVTWSDGVHSVHTVFAVNVV